MNILVFLGANKGFDPIYEESAKSLGKWIGENSHTLIYGANSKGLMGILADETIKFGGKVIGVMPKFLKSTEIPHSKLDEYIETDTMQERKDIMRSMADICIALPGGPGTMEEITEAISLFRVKQSKAPCVFFNVNNYYDLMKNMYDQMLKQGFVSKEDRDNILFSDDLDEIVRFYTLLRGRND